MIVGRGSRPSVLSDVARKQGRIAAMFVAVNGKATGRVAVADRIKASTPEAIPTLREENLRIVMPTGDNRIAARAVAGELGIDEVVAEVLPEDKHDAIRRLQSEGRTVSIAGDGDNDAPALAAADAGLAIRTGADVAVESAGITLVRGDLTALATARRLSRAMVSVIGNALRLR